MSLRGTVLAAAVLFGGASVSCMSAGPFPDAQYYADGQDAKPEAGQEGAKKKPPVEATIVTLKGVVDVKRPEDKDWVPAKKDMKLKKGSEICTSVAARVTLLFANKIRVGLKPLTQAKIDDLARAAGTLKTGVNLKFGTIEVDIQKGDLRADMKVTAPNSTTSVSGSHGLVRAPAAMGLERRVILRAFEGVWEHSAANRTYWVTITSPFGDTATNRGDLRRDLYYRFRRAEFLQLFGRTRTEAYMDPFNIKAIDPLPIGIPVFEFSRTWVASLKHLKAGGLPRPPNPPITP